MSNFFEDVSNNATQVEEELLGPNYKYYAQSRYNTFRSAFIE